MEHKQRKVKNKADLLEDVGRVIDQDACKAYAEDANSIYIETSAKTGVGVNEMFYSLSNMMLTASSSINEMSPPE